MDYEESREMCYRHMEPEDMVPVRFIHEQCLPVRYNTAFYENIVRNVVQRTDDGPREPVYTQVAVLPWAGEHPNPFLQCGDGAMVGLITAQLAQPLTQSSAADTIAFVEPQRHDMVAYILTLGVLDEYRRAGVGAALLRRCVAAARAEPRCGAVFLHVITYNAAAMAFYARAGFVRVCEVSGYYQIDGARHSCYVYALFLNGAALAHAAPHAHAHLLDGDGAYYYAPETLLAAVTGRLRRLVGLLRRWLGMGDEGRRKEAGGGGGGAVSNGYKRGYDAELDDDAATGETLA
ncbi:acyl-CoA N-acyltransferase [Tribonema minus]|uniref:N-alpha-acetyltransferase 60 n=1 Tax=Tribonema minus TaxID=303371 RepID=A0A835ZFD1_9STRA|nr:acyl-CoA N-acyltransferase [Tribonema minus]